MKKTIQRVFCAVLCLLLCLSMCACGSTPEPTPTPTPDPTPKTISQTDAEAIAKQALVNIFCRYRRTEQLSFNAYKIETIARNESCYRGDTYQKAAAWEIKVNGSYYPVDKFGEYMGKTYFSARMEVYDDGAYTYREVACSGDSDDVRYFNLYGDYGYLSPHTIFDDYRFNDDPNSVFYFPYERDKVYH